MRNVLVAAGWAWAAAIVWLSLTPSPPELDITYGDKLGHFAAYGLLMLWFTQLMSRGAAASRTPACSSRWASRLEFLQGALGYRIYDIVDMYANTLGVALGWALGAMLPPLLPGPEISRGCRARAGARASSACAAGC